MGEGTNAPIEGNVFDSSPGATFAVDSSDLCTHTSAMGRTCEANSLVNTGELSAAD